MLSGLNKSKSNILVVGPISGNKHQEIVFPILSPDPATNKDVHFLNYPVYVGGNRGRGQVYPSGEKSNNTVYTASATGQITAIDKNEEGKSLITIFNKETEKSVTETVPPGPTLLVKVGDTVSADQPLTNNPNVGGFGQADAEIVLQNPLRVIGLIVFLFTICLAQIFLVLKKKQFEKVQLADMNF